MTQKYDKLSEKVILEEVVIPFLREDLGYKLIDPRLQRVPVRFGRETKYADTVVFIIKNAKKTPHIVVESKAPGEVLDWEQAESYAQRLGAPYFLVTDGRTWYWYQTGERQGESQKLLNAPKPPAYIEEEVLVAFEDLNELSKVVGKCHDIIRNEEGFDPTIAFDEISKLLFAKMQDEKEIEQGFKDDTGRTPKSDYEFKIGKDELPEDVGRKVKSLFERAENKYPEIFEGMSEDIKYIKLRFPTIFHVVEELQSYTLQETSIDIKGATYEFFIRGTFMGRGLGQYFTPREIVEFMVDMVEPKRRHYIFDPACGSGGFLITCMDRVFSEIDELYRQRGLDNPKQEKWKFATQHLYGTDLNERMTWVAKMNMVMHGDGHGGIFKHDGFIDSERIEPILDIVRIRGGFDVILTNPPFGSKIKNQDILSEFELGKGKKEQLTEALFIERCLDFLKPGELLGIVVPDGTVLSNPSSRDIREFIKQRAVTEAIVSLPPEAFLPYGSSQKASILFLRKKDNEGRLEQGDIFMGIADTVGYDPVGRKIASNDLKVILKRYSLLKEKEKMSLEELDKQNGIPKIRLSELTSEFPADEDEKGTLIPLQHVSITDRLDVDYYRPKIKRLLAVLNKIGCVRLDDVLEPKLEKVKIDTPEDPSMAVKFIERIDSKTGQIIYAEKPFKDIPMGARFIFSPRCLIVSRINAKIGCIGILSNEIGDILATGEYYALKPKTGLSLEYLHEILRSSIVRQQILVRTSGLFSRLNEDQLRQILIPLPDFKEQEKIRQARKGAKQLRQQADNLEKETFAKILEAFEERA